MASVKDFGAVGDGIADDTAAFSSAISALQGGGVLSIPKGIYNVGASTGSELFHISDTIKIIGDGATVDGSWIRVRSSTPDTCDIFRISPVGVAAPFVEIRGICITPQTPDSFIGGKDAIAIKTDANSQLQRFLISDCWINAGSGYAISGMDEDVSVSTAAYYQSVIQRNTLFGKSGGINFTQCGDSISIIDNNFPPLGDYGVKISPAPGAALQVIERNGFQGNSKGAIYLSGCDQVKVRDNQIEQGVTFNGLDGMITIDNCRGCELSGNNINSFSESTAISIKGNSTRNIIERNTINVSGAMVHISMSSDVKSFNNIYANSFLIDYVQLNSRLIIQTYKPQIGVWIPLTLYNGWTASGINNEYQGLRYKLNDDMSVIIDGSIKNGANNPTTIIAALPIEIAPKFQSYFDVWCAGNMLGILTVRLSGELTVSGTVLPNTSAVKLTNRMYSIY